MVYNITAVTGTSATEAEDHRSLTIPDQSAGAWLPMLCSVFPPKTHTRAGVCGSSETGKEGLELLVVAGGYLPVPLTLRNTGHGSSDAVGGSQDFQDLSGLNSD